MLRRAGLLFAILSLVVVAAGATGGASSRPVAVRPSGHPVAVDGDGVRELITKTLVPHAIIIYKACMLKGPVENFVRRFIGGSQQRARIWTEYTNRRDELIASKKVQGAALAGMMDDLKLEFTHRYPAWRELWLL